MKNRYFLGILGLKGGAMSPQKRELINLSGQLGEGEVDEFAS